MSIDYSQYGYFGHLCEVPQDVLNNLQETFDYFTTNIKPGMDTSIKSDRLKFLYRYWQTPKYKQWFIQSNDKEHVLTFNDLDWTVWNDENKLEIAKDFLHNYVNQICRFRFSLLNKGTNVDFHTKHMLPRIHIPLNNVESFFQIKDEKDNIHSYKLEYGHMHFINTTYLHRVIGSNTNDRHNCFFSFDQFKDIKMFEKFIK